MSPDTMTMAQADAALVAPEVPEVPSSPASPEAPAEPAQPRDSTGRFTAEPEAPVVEETTPPVEPEPVDPSAEPETPTDETPETFPEMDYRADGQDYTIAGSQVGEDGVFIPTQSVAELQQLLAEGRAARGSVRQRLGESAAREQQATRRAEAAEAQAQQVLAHFEQLVESGQIGSWLEQVQQNWPILKAEAKAKALELQQQGEREELTRYREAQQREQLRPAMEQTLETDVLTYGTQAGLDEQAMQGVFDLLHEPQYEGLVFVRAQQDLPQVGLRKGDWAINHTVVESAVRLAAAGRGPRQAIQAAVKQNAAQQVKAKIPPTVAGKGAKAPRPGPAIPKFQSREEVDKWFNDSGFNDIETGE